MGLREWLGLKPRTPSLAPRRSGPTFDYVKPHIDYPDKAYPILRVRPWDYGQNPGVGFGFETPDGRIWTKGRASISRWATLGVFVIPVVGMRFRRPDSESALFDPGRPVRFVAEPDNPFDKNAIAVWDWSRSLRVGYVPEDKTQRVRKVFKGGAELGVMVLACRWEAGVRESLDVVVFRPDRLLGVDDVRTVGLEVGEYSP